MEKDPATLASKARKTSSRHCFARRLGEIFRSLEQNLDLLSLEEIETIHYLLRTADSFLSADKQQKQLQRAVKRQKTSRGDAAVARPHAHDPAVSVPPEALRVLAHSGFLRSQELGRTLLLTNRSSVTTLTPNFVYQIIYETRRKDRWASPATKLRVDEWVPQTVVLARGHRAVLQAMEAPPDIKKGIVALPQMLPRSKLHSNNTVVIVSLWVLSQKIYSHRLTQKELESLTGTGHCYLPIQKSTFDIAKMAFQDDKAFARELQRIRREHRRWENNHSGMKTADSTGFSKRVTPRQDEPLVTAKIHAIRLDTHQLCTLYNSKLPRYEMHRSHSTDDSVNFPLQRALRMSHPKRDSSGNSSHIYGGGVSDDDLIARWFQGWPEGIQNVGGLTFQVSLNKRPSQLASMHIEAKVLGATASQSESLRARHGVSPFHILEGLAGWK